MVQQTLSAGIIPFQKSKQGVLYLILRSYNYWDFPKGMVMEGEDPLQAAQRELEEETSLQKVHFSFGHEFYETEIYSRGKVARYYLGEVTEGEVKLQISAELGRPEHHEFRWVTAAEAEKLFVPRLKKVLQWAEKILKS